MDYEDETTT
jgi:hypothetical protein